MSMEQKRLLTYYSMERRPRMLKDFLSENNLNSCSSSTGFKSLPRKLPNNNTRSLIQLELKSSSSSSTFQTLINTIRSISFFTSAIKPPSVLSLPRSLSRKLSSSRKRRNNNNNNKRGNEIIRTVKIKDIIRWKSFRDINHEDHQQRQQHISLPPPSPLGFHAVASATTTTATTTATCSSSGSSWSESDFFTSSWEARHDNVEAGKKSFPFSPLVVGEDSVPTEDEQHSPVSVLQVGEDEFSLFDQSLANIERRKQKFMQTVQEFESLVNLDLANLDKCLSLDYNSGYGEDYEEEEDDDGNNEVEEHDWIEEKAKQLLHCVKASGSVQSCKDNLDKLLLDFFRKELIGSGNQNKNDEEFEREIMRVAEDWINGSFAYDIGHVNKDSYIKDMDKRGQWSRFEEEQEELAFEIETAILHSLVFDLLDLDG
ncbi:hypothetical protein RJT34_15429 [Clitoria ternatea]|uniref:DUF4378 domain-containing protein n=1 Tax=Clitoria ternatea TaxID=43366 RepID=A0AAN9PBE7_CLITE